MIVRRMMILLGSLFLTASAQHAQANWNGAYAGPDLYTAEFSQVPDFDQWRGDLPRNGGMFCAPTAAVNWMAYIARHGYPLLRPGSQSLQYWHSQDNYDEVTELIVDMGDLMDTDPVEGTRGTIKSSLQQWIAQSGLSFLFTVNGTWLHHDTPRFDNIAAWLNQRVPVIGVVGWYIEDGTSMVRDGGHVVSVVKVSRNGLNRQFTFLDPADGMSLSEQSAVNPRTFAIEERLRFVLGFPRFIDKVVDYGSAYIDGYYTIRPLAGLTTSNDGRNLVFMQPLNFDFGFTPAPAPSPHGALIADLAFHPNHPDPLVVTREVPGVASSKLYRYDLAESRFIVQADLDDGKAVVSDRFGRIYALDGRSLRCFELDADGQAHEVADRVPDLLPLAIAVDDVNDRLTVLCDGSVLPFDLRTLDAQPPVPIPAGVVLGGQRAIGVSPVDGRIFLVGDLSPGVYRLDGQGGYEVVGAGVLSRPRGLSVGDGDCVTVIDLGGTGLTKVFCPDPQGGGWQELTDAPFAGLELLRPVKVAYSRTSFDPAIHDGPGYYNVPPETVASVFEPVGDRAVSATARIAGVSPNPFNPSTLVTLEMPQAATATLAVHDMGGRLVRTLHNGVLDAGRHVIAWDGADESGTPMASGIYMVRLMTSDGAQRMVKVTLAK